MNLATLKERIKANSEGLLRIRSASGCRENWLHGQLYLSDWGSSKCWVNEFPYPNQKVGAYNKADLVLGSSIKKPDLIAEIKFVGTRYYQKSKLKVPAASFWKEIENLPVPADKPGRRLCQLSNQELRQMTSWGIIHDYFRLADVTTVQTRVLALVLDRHPNGPDKAGRLFESITFEGTETDFVNSSELLIRAWVLPGAAQ